SGSTDMAPYLSLADQRRLLISVPPVAEQRRISGVLGALDDKVEHNRQLAESLASMARVLFERVDSTRRSDSPRVPLGESLSPASAPAHDRNTPYIGLDAMPRGSTVLWDWLPPQEAPTGQASGFERGDVLFGKLRPYFKKVGVAPIHGRCSTEILVLRP